MLVEGPDASAVSCDGCGEGCLAEIELIDGLDGTPPRAYVICEQRDDISRVAVPLEALRTWIFRPEALAQWLADQTEATELVELHPKSLWRLTTGVSGAAERLFVSIGADSNTVRTAVLGADAMSLGPSPVVLVPVLPTSPGAGIRWVQFVDHISISPDGLALDRGGLGRALRGALKDGMTPELIFSPAGEIIRFRGRDLALTPIERAIMALLVRRCNRWVEIGALARAGWSDEMDHMDAVRPVISRLRQKLGDPTIIHTNRGRHDSAGAYCLRLKQYQIAEDE
jgi:hypothetical protein